MTDVKEKRKIPAYVLVGFLGSGKTTLLGKLIEHYVERDETPGLIVNEFGTVSIDGEMLRQEGMEMTELSNGCICCTADEDLIPALIMMSGNPKVKVILLEASGLADPADMLDELTDPSLWESVEVGGIISVTDALRFEDLHQKTPLARRQVEYADAIVLSKCDMVSEKDRTEVIELLRTLNAQARLFISQEGEPVEGVEAVLNYSRQVGITHEVPEDAHHHDHDHDHDHSDHDHAEHEHDHHGHEPRHLSVHTIDFDMDKPLKKEMFEQFLNNLPKEVYRAKGFIWVDGDERPYVFQHMPGYVRVLPFQRHRPSIMRAVFIGQNLDREWLTNQLIACEA
jgi:G3E family GTPase